MWVSSTTLNYMSIMLGYVHLRDGVQDPKKYEAVQNSHV